MDLTTEAALQVEQTRVLLDQLCAVLRLRQVPGELTSEQRAALARVEVAMNAYVDYFYPRESRHLVD